MLLGYLIHFNFYLSDQCLKIIDDVPFLTIIYITVFSGDISAFE